MRRVVFFSIGLARCYRFVMRLGARAACFLLLASCARPAPGPVVPRTDSAADVPPSEVIVPARRPTCTGPRCRGWTALLLSGGRDRDDNAVAHERNMEFASRTLASAAVPRSVQTLLFGDGADPEPDVSIEEPDEQRRRLLFAIGLLRTADDESRGSVIRYRNHEIQGVEPADHAHVLAAIADDAKEATRHEQDTSGPPSADLFFYVTDHGLKRNDLTDNVIVLWGRRDLTVRELGAALDAEPPSRRVVTVMAQCFSGSFSSLVHEGGDPMRGIAPADRCGFFAAPADRPAAGCSPKSDDFSYDDYTTRFFSALSGVDRAGNPVRSADLDADGRVTFEEAHLAAIREERTQDVPVSSSEEFLRRSRPDWIAEAQRDTRSIALILKDSRPAIDVTIRSLLLSLDLPLTTRLDELHQRAEELSTHCWPGLCEAEEARKEARKSAHLALQAAARGMQAPLTPASLALVVLGRPQIEQWIAAAQPSFDRAVQLEDEVEKLRTESENAEARVRRAARLVELAIAEENLRAEGGEVASAYKRIRACETSGLWERDAPRHDVASSDSATPTRAR